MEGEATALGGGGDGVEGGVGAVAHPAKPRSIINGPSRRRRLSAHWVTPRVMGWLASITRERLGAMVFPGATPARYNVAMDCPLPDSWKTVLADEIEQPYFAELQRFITAERELGAVYPAEPDVFAALHHTPYTDVRVLLLGQDPYPGAGQAHGLCFSVRPGVKLPASLRNIFKELHADLGCPVPRSNGSLLRWARQGVLLLNTVLTVRGGNPLSHRGRGWEKFTDAIIRRVSEKPERVVFVLWGGQAQAKKKLIDGERHFVLESAHPSPLSAHGGFFGSRPFSRINDELSKSGEGEIDWKIDEMTG